mgnify:FL=1
MLNIIIFGKPGSGKGTQASLIKDNYSLVHISTGDVFRKNTSQGTDLGKVAVQFMSKGEVVADDIAVSRLKEEIKSFIPCNGFIFDGFPRTIIQAESLDDLLKSMELNIDMVVALDVENNKLIERLLNRGKTSGRSDDKSEEKINKRLEEYDKKTKPLIDFYKNQKKFISINGVGDLNDVTTRLISIIDSKIS